MPRNLIALSDGTGNSAAKAFKTNVWRLYQALDLTDPSQLAVFGDGVGTSTFKPLQLLGLALGIGVRRNVLKLYKFLCFNYHDGDRIWCFGFSRGAFTVRTLAGLIHHEGLVSFITEEELDRNIIAAYRAYRRKAFPSKLPWVQLGRALRDLVVAAWNRTTHARSYKEIREETFKGGHHIINIHFIGVWDTVAAYGLPIDELTQAVDKWVWPMSFRDTSLLPNVHQARHALSIDDERRTFFPIPWSETEEIKLRAQDPTISSERLLQVWFAGAHASVGGGYPDDALAYVPLCWMMEQATAEGLRLKPDVVSGYSALATPTGRMYDSRGGFGAFYRYQPRDVSGLMGKDVRPLIHYSVITRMVCGNDGYAPISLPHDIDVLPPYGPRLAFDATEAASLRNSVSSPPVNGNSMSKERDHLLQNIVNLNQAVVAQNRAPLFDLVLDTVWWRRVVYFTSLFLALIAVVYPVIWRYIHIQGITEEATAATGGVVEWAIGLVKGFLPSFAAPWLTAVVNAPAVAAFVLSLLAGSLALSAFLQRRIRDRSRAAWGVKDLSNLRLTGQRRAATRGIIFFGGALAATWLLQGPPWLMVFFAVSLVPWFVLFLWRTRHDAGNIDVSNPGILLGLARRLRTSETARAIYRWLARTAGPALFLAACVLLACSITYRAAFDALSTMGGLCQASQTLPPGSPQEILGTGRLFRTDSMCHATGLFLVQGRRYRIILTVEEQWFDKSRPTDVRGFSSDDVTQYFGLPLRRWWFENWFQLIARVGRLGNYEYALKPAAPLAERSSVLISDIAPATSGELFIYVNDAVLLWPGLLDFFYRNNLGTAKVEVLPVRADAIIPDY